MMAAAIKMYVAACVRAGGDILFGTDIYPPYVVSLFFDLQQSRTVK
ncbi:hypothetical protein HMPREF1250_0587 [Megasphaera vaginalis (ex Srinivasan et al. 2021)]|uniref:Uncharacterized protein n=1 Tax=Megasphaera vaginalis (ex Srinivasan et al. 2021) TaxID=1111454 RepID=U7UNX7_9FIRM|nr:hypothetical protein HMPREF1250_0587 [Megasphaera vaginalis (ex Srinivasan et al. 2021)]